MFSWYKNGTSTERKTFWACFAGWALDALDAQIFSLAIPALIAAFALNRSEVGVISGATLVASALGGWVTGALSDRFGRVRTLQFTILWFSLFTFASAFAQSYTQLLTLKALQGFGFGGEWAAGAVLMAETIRPENRGKAMGTVQSAWAVGWGAAVLLFTALFYWLPQEDAWRVMFGFGLLPATLVIYVRRAVVEPQISVDARRVAQSAAARGEARPASSLVRIFAPDLLRVTVVGGLLGVGAHGGYYALMTWLPTYLQTERHLSVLNTGGYLAVIIVAFWCGCIAERAAARSPRAADDGRRVRDLLRADRLRLPVPAGLGHADAGPRVPARFLRGRHPGQPGYSLQRAVPGSRPWGRRRFLLQLRPRGLGGLPVARRAHECVDAARTRHRHRRRVRIRPGRTCGAAVAGDERTVAAGAARRPRCDRSAALASRSLVTSTTNIRIAARTA